MNLNELKWGAGPESRPVESWGELYADHDAQWWVGHTVTIPSTGKEARICGYYTILLDGQEYELNRDFPDDLLTEDDIAALIDKSDELGSDEGPMMNYWYPCEGLGDYTGAALQLADLPLCVVEVNGEPGLALTGGGMDLSWEIASAFVRLGYYPPAFITDLPDMAGIEPLAQWRLDVVNACIFRDLQAAERLGRQVEHLTRYLP